MCDKAKQKKRYIEERNLLNQICYLQITRIMKFAFKV
jgi:hypothetical protein